jgi:hypothetical protein
MSWLRKLFGHTKNSEDTSPPKPSGHLPQELWFKSGKSALEYIGKFMQTDWRAGSLVMGLVSNPSLSDSHLTARVLIPDGDKFQDILCITPIKGVIIPGEREFAVTSETVISDIGIQTGDLVCVYLGGEAPPSIQAATKWWGFIVGVNELCYSLERAAWKMKLEFEIANT